MSKPIPQHKGRSFLGSTDFVESPPHFLLKLGQQYEEIIEFNFAHLRFVMVTSPELVREILVTKAKHFRKAKRDVDIMSKFIGMGLVTSDGAHHQKQRKLAQPAFHVRRIAEYGDVMVDYTADMLDQWQVGEVRDISDEMFKLTMYIVTKTIFDVDKDAMVGQAERIGEAMHHLQAITNGDFNRVILWPEWVPTKSNRIRKQERQVLDDTIADLVATRRATAGADGLIQDKGDLLSMLLLSQDEDNNFMTDTELRDELVTLFTAGHETTSNALTWTWYLLSQHPEVMAKLQAEIDSVLGTRLPTMNDLPSLPYTEMVIKEAMRLYPPAWTLNGREANEEVMIGDYLIEKDTYIFVAPYVMHRLERYFPEPERFDPERFSPENEAQMEKYSYIPFGGGPRVCIGNAFAMMEARLILATMVQRFEFELLPEQVVEINPLITMSAKYGLRMRLKARQATAEAAKEARLAAV